jgi:hypothetical protein
VSVRELVLLSPRRDVEEPALDADD